MKKITAIVGLLAIVSFAGVSCANKPIVKPQENLQGKQAISTPASVIHQKMQATSQKPVKKSMNKQMGMMGMMSNMSRQCQQMSQKFKTMGDHFQKMLQINDIKLLKTELKKQYGMMQSINKHMIRHINICKRMMSAHKAGKMISHKFKTMEAHIQKMLQINDIKLLKTELKKQYGMMQSMNKRMIRHINIRRRMMSSYKTDKVISHKFKAMEAHFQKMLQMNNIKLLKTELKKQYGIMQSMNKQMIRHINMCKRMMSSHKKGEMNSSSNMNGNMMNKMHGNMMNR